MPDDKSIADAVGVADAERQPGVVAQDAPDTDTPAGTSVKSGDPKVFVLMRELSEVHLLLDNIASSSEKSLPVASAPPPDGLDAAWLLKVCEIDWPPEKTEPKGAVDAELLIRVKDHLNNLAKPASGLTIAFTQLVTQERAGPKRVRPSDSDVPSRGSLAILAYPDLVGKAHTFRRGVRGISVFLLVWLLFTCLASWYIAFGNAALAQRAAAQTAFDVAEQRVEEIAAGPSATRAGSASASVRAASSETGTGPVPALADGVPSASAAATDKILPPDCPSATGKGAPEAAGTRQTRACATKESARVALVQADEQIARWTMVPGRFAGPGRSSFALAMAGVIGTAILPVLYGILGAGAAVLRALSRKMKFSLLSPRDLNLSIQQLALGAVTGACIGIFIAQPSSAAAGLPTLIAPVALSTSALSFVAGFGVDAVFGMLEGIIARVFNVSSPSSAPVPPVR